MGLKTVKHAAAQRLPPRASVATIPSGSRPQFSGAFYE
jgi:hypothetical protein